MKNATNIKWRVKVIDGEFPLSDTLIKANKENKRLQLDPIFALERSLYGTSMRKIQSLIEAKLPAAEQEAGA